MDDIDSTDTLYSCFAWAHLLYVLGLTYLLVFGLFGSLLDMEDVNGKAGPTTG